MSDWGYIPHDRRSRLCTAPNSFMRLLGPPPLEALVRIMHLVHPQDESPWHWYWNGDWNSNYEAAAKLNTASGPPALFQIVRVFMHHRHGGLAMGTTIVNQCGKMTCINPDHWFLQSPSDLRTGRRRAVVNGRVWNEKEEGRRRPLVPPAPNDEVHRRRRLGPPRRHEGALHYRDNSRIEMTVCGLDLADKKSFRTVSVNDLTCPRCIFLMEPYRGSNEGQVSSQ